MRKLTITSGTGFAAFVAIAVATVLAGNTSSPVHPGFAPAKMTVDRMPSIERMTIEARDLPVQYHHPI